MKKNTILFIIAAFVFSFTLPCGAAIGQSAVITLVFPIGARSFSMGEVGTALADDESVLFFNPAGLDVPNERWRGGAASVSYEPLLPYFKMKDLWHLGIAANMQDTTFSWGAPGIFFNFINKGKNGHYLDPTGSWSLSGPESERVLALGWGFDFKDLGIKNHYFGLTLKWFNSTRGKDEGGGSVNSVAFDFGYLWTIGKHFRLGATLMNMGPSIYYRNDDHRFPLPFTLNCAVAYKKTCMFEGLDFFSIAAELRLDKEMVRSHPDGKPDPFYKAFFTEWTDRPLHDEFSAVNEHLGYEVTLLNTISLRGGYLIDITGVRYEYHFGFGINIYNHFSFNYGRIHSPDGFMRDFSQMFDPHNTGSTGVRHKQWQISFTATRFFDWNENDREWWKSKK